MYMDISQVNKTQSWSSLKWGQAFVGGGAVAPQAPHLGAPLQRLTIFRKRHCRNEDKSRLP